MIGWNASAAALTVSASMWIAVSPLWRSEQPSPVRRMFTAQTEIVSRDGERGVLDASGRFVPIRPYTRVVSGSTVTDGMLLELCEPWRVLRFTNHSVEESPFRHRFGGKGTHDPLSDLETLVALKPDLVLVHNFGSAERVARLREAGLAVFDFGEMRGITTLLPNLRTLGALVGRAERGAELAARFERRLRAVAWDVPEADRPGAVYVSVYGDKLYGGTDGTSYHDVLGSAGLRDVAAERYDDWPDYTAEELLTLDPEFIVTHDGMQRLVCAHPGLDRLRACRGGTVIGIDGALIGNPGLDMLEAAEALFEAVHWRKEARHGR